MAGGRTWHANNAARRHQCAASASKSTCSAKPTNGSLQLCAPVLSLLLGKQTDAGFHHGGTRWLVRCQDFAQPMGSQPRFFEVTLSPCGRRRPPGGITPGVRAYGDLFQSLECPSEFCRKDHSALSRGAEAGRSLQANSAPFEPERICLALRSDSSPGRMALIWSSKNSRKLITLLLP